MVRQKKKKVLTEMMFFFDFDAIDAVDGVVAVDE